MHIFASFRHSTYLEIALNELEQIGVPKSRILAVPFRNQNPKTKNVVLTHKGDPIGVNFGFIFGTACMLLGVIYGFIWKWGPVIWGIIGLLAGGLIGYLIDIVRIKMNQRGVALTEVILIVDCEHFQVDEVEVLLWNHRALGIAKLEVTDDVVTEV